MNPASPAKLYAGTFLGGAFELTQAVDLEVLESESADPVVAGSGPGNLTYEVTLTNRGLLAASGVELTLTLTLPPGVSVDAVAPSGATGFADPVWTVGDLAIGASETLTVTLTVGPAAAPGTEVVTSTATVTAVSEGDGDPGNDAATISTSILAPQLPGGAPEIPTLRSAGLWLLALALAGLGVAVLRRSPGAS
jgi:uncharacterized repeat protein (TIGR01451 family)